MDNSSEPEQDCNNAEEKLSNVRRPMNAFFIFCKRHRDIVREKYPHLENRSITKILGEWWANLETSEKASYTALAKQYKEAFMKAHPGFKWYKLPAPPTRTLVTRPSNNRFNQNENCNISGNCGITLGKLVDDEQLGGLSSLINSTPTALPPTSTNLNSVHSLKMDDKGESLLKPPKKRYLQNGEFQSQFNESSIENRDCQTRDACTALLELAKICSSNISQEVSSVQSCSNNSIPTSTAIRDHGYSFPCTATSNDSLAVTTVSDINSDSQQDQPLDLCKNKDKTAVVKEASKTITTSHQQLIDHFVDKFLCDTPVPPKFYKSEIIDPTLCKMFAEKNRHIPSSKEGKNSHSAFTLSVAIESAVDKAYSRDSTVSYKPKILDSKDLKSLPSDNSKFNMQFKVEGAASKHKKPFNFENNSNMRKNFFWPTSINQDYKKESHMDKSMSQHDRLNDSQTSNLKSDVSFNCNKSKSYDNLVASPKKSSVWGNFFKNEQHNSDSQDNLQISNSFIEELSSRRSSQRSCKGKRYQELLTEGLLQSHKERKLSYNKKTLPYQYKVKSKINSSFETHTISSPKKKKKEYGCKNKSSTEAYGLGTSLFNLEEKIASLPKCNFENLNKKRKNLENSIEDREQQARDNLCDTSMMENDTLSNVESPSVSSSGRYRTGNFDLEQQIAFLPKCNIEVLRKRNNE